MKIIWFPQIQEEQKKKAQQTAGIILGMGSANEGRFYSGYGFSQWWTLLIGWIHT